LSEQEADNLLLRSVFGLDQLSQQVPDSPVDLVDDRPNIVDRFACWVFKVPVEIALARVHRAGVPAAHSHDDVGLEGGLVGERLGELPGGVETTLAEDRNDRRIELGSRFGTGGSDVDPAVGIVVEQNPGGEAPASVVGTEEQHDRLVAHLDSLAPVEDAGVTVLGQTPFSVGG
jgi:hypothetical protein